MIGGAVHRTIDRVEVTTIMRRWILDDAIEAVWVIDARHMRNVPGRRPTLADA